MGEGLFGLNKKLEQETDESWTVALIRGVNKVRKETWNSAKGAPRLLDIIITHSPHVETVCLLSKLCADQHIEVELKIDETDLTLSGK